MKCIPTGVLIDYLGDVIANASATALYLEKRRAPDAAYYRRFLKDVQNMRDHVVEMSLECEDTPTGHGWQVICPKEQGR